MGFLDRLFGHQDAMHAITAGRDTSGLDLYGIAYQGAMDESAVLDQQAASTAYQDQIDEAIGAGDFDAALAELLARLGDD